MGRIIYVPNDLIKELENVKKKKNLKGSSSNSIALQEIAKNSRVARAIENLYDDSFNILTLGIHKKIKKKR